MAIVGTLLSDDWYKASMRAAVLRYYPDTVVCSRFTNRNADFPVARYIDLGELRDEFAALRELRFSKAEVAYYASLGVLSQQFLDSLSTYHIPEIEVDTAPGDQLNIEVATNWADGMPAEVHVLGIVTELVSRALAKEMGLGPAAIRREGYRHLDEAIAFFRAHPDLKVAPFGARRHFSQAWEYEATARLVDQIPDQIAGISNVALAREFGYPLSGTIAHEYFIVPTMIEIGQGNPNAIRDAQNQTMDHWEELYADKWDGGMLCTIPDTFGTPSFLAHFTPERALKWRVHKQDSGDPKVFVERMLSWLGENGQDPRLHRINHTDGLTVAKMAELHDYCQARYMVGFGWGTRHSNNVGVPTHSFVWKPSWVMVDGERVPAAKLTDNLAKATGDPAMIARLKELTDDHTTFSEQQDV